MEREVEKNKTRESEEQMEALRNIDVSNGPFPQQQLQPQPQHYIHHQINGGGLSPAFFDTSRFGFVHGEGPSSSSSCTPFSPISESERLMKELGILSRLDFLRVVDKNNQGNVCRYIENPAMEIVSPSTLCRNFPEENPSNPYVNGLRQQNGFQSDWNELNRFYMPFSDSETTRPTLNPRLPMLGRQDSSSSSSSSYPQTYRTSDALLQEDNFLLQRNTNRRVENNARMGQRGRRTIMNLNELNTPPISTRAQGGTSFLKSLKYESVWDLRGCIYFVTQDQQCCRFLQNQLAEKKQEYVGVIFNELVGHVAELMANSFANYLMQTLFEVCNEEQKLEIVLELTKRPFQLVELSMNSHGTRAAQKLIDTLTTQQHVRMFMSALEPGLLLLIKDINGHHVIQRCLTCFSSEDNKRVLDVAVKNSVGIATDQYGCCVLQRCIEHSSGQIHNTLIMNIAKNGMMLAQHCFGNYAVQFIIEKKFPLANLHLMAQFKGNFVELSKNKFSSNVVEKCLVLWEEGRKVVITELLSAEHYDMLLQHQYANYVIYKAFSVAKGALHDALVAATRPYAESLRTNPYCKKIFSKSCFRN